MKEKRAASCPIVLAEEDVRCLRGRRPALKSPPGQHTAASGIALAPRGVGDAHEGPSPTLTPPRERSRPLARAPGVSVGRAAGAERAHEGTEGTQGGTGRTAASTALCLPASGALPTTPPPTPRTPRVRVTPRPHVCHPSSPRPESLGARPRSQHRLLPACLFAGRNKTPPFYIYIYSCFLSLFPSRCLRCGVGSAGDFITQTDEPPRLLSFCLFSSSGLFFGGGQVAFEELNLLCTKSQ